MSNSTYLNSIKSVLICEDHPFVQIGLKTSLKEILPHLQNLRLACLGKEALQLAYQEKPDLVIVDLDLPDMSGVTLIQNLQAAWSNIKILVVTSCHNPATLLQVKKLNVLGIIQKVSSLELLNSVFKNIKAGKNEIFIDPAIISILQEHHEVEFTPREYEILQFITQGLSNQKISDKLGCAITTVRFHRANILQKTNIRTGSELTAWFLQGQRQRN